MLFFKVFISLLFFLTSVDLSEAQNGSGMPVSWHFNTTNPRGPDGPWSALDIQVGWPPESVSVYPGRSQATLVVSKAVCQRQGSNCSNPGAGLYDKIPVKNLTLDELDIRSDNIPGWNNNLTDPLQLKGPVTHVLERITISLQSGGEQYLDNLTFLVSNGMTVNFLGGVQTSLDTGILSLASKRTNETNITTSFEGASVETYTPLAFLGVYGGGSDVPISASWGLHVGSARHNVFGSLYFGGYDEARILGTPGIFDSTAILLTNVFIDSTIAAFQSTSNLLDPANTPSSNVSVVPKPAVPYLYLPPAVCTSLASHLPVNFDPDLQLYTWDLGHPSLPTLLSSFSNLRFTFTNSSNIFITIAIPLALLNLTLTSSLVKTPTPYFPCRPYTLKLPGGTGSGSAQYYLGRAFLQGAFIGQNWDTESYFLAQASGPSLPQSRVVIIEPNDTAISATVDSSAWEDTWKNILSKDGIGQVNTSSAQNNSSPVSASTATGSGPGSGSSLSRKAVIGISVACAIVGLAAFLIAVVWMRSRRSRRKNIQEFEQNNSGKDWKKPELNVDTPVLVGEMEGTGHVHELSTDNRFEMKGVESRHIHEVQAEKRRT